jgi:glycerol-3-phosphate acyltransferase PlsX
MSNSDFNRPKCRIIVDAMGGDFAPLNAIQGAIDALNENPDFELYLVGKEDKIDEIIKTQKLKFNRSDIINATQVIDMAEAPTTALKSKPDSSIIVGSKLVKEGKADAFVSAGNTGAVMAAATLIMGRIAGVGRPTIGSFIPNLSGISTLYDVGASVDSKPRHLLEYAIMGSIFVKEIYGIENPKVAVLSVGEEETKGNELVFAAAELLKKTNLNFIGNVEGRDILKGTAHVVVCDGFVGNVLLKFGEGFLTFLKTKLKDYAGKSFFNMLKLGLIKSSLKNILKDFDYQEYGGVPLLGVNGICIIGHGSSTAKAIKNMVLRAKEMYDKNLVSKIEYSLKNYSNLS